MLHTHFSGKICCESIKINIKSQVTRHPKSDRCQLTMVQTRWLQDHISERGCRVSVYCTHVFSSYCTMSLMLPLRMTVKSVTLLVLLVTHRNQPWPRNLDVGIKRQYMYFVSNVILYPTYSYVVYVCKDLIITMKPLDCYSRLFASLL